MPPVTSDIYGWDKIYASTFNRLKADPSIPVEQNRDLILKFCKSREARGLSIPRVVKYAYQLMVVARFCAKPFESMSQDDVRDLLVELKNNGKHNQSWTRQSKYSETTMCDIKIFLKIFWRWMKGMDETKPIYPPEVSWFTKGKVRNSNLNRADLLTDSEIELLASSTGDAQDSAFVRVLDDAGGRITEILTLRISDVEERPYGFRLNVWASKTCAHPIPIARSAPALARWLSVHPFRDNPAAPLWLDSRLKQAKYASARRKLENITKLAQEKLTSNGERIFWKRVFFHLFRHTSATAFMTKGKGSQGVMNKKYGWSPNSRMPALYSHLVDSDVEEAVAQADAHPSNFSQMMLERKESIERARPKKCSRCDGLNDPSSRYCCRCAFPLDEEAALNAFNAEDKKAEAETDLEQLMKDERVKKAMFEVLSEISLKKISRETVVPPEASSEARKA
ncbi:MAG: tyrosine-type recombinase/integrase [Thaumarchaeota archaeon]|nr:tyrosine-type recombinase/integrase [Nitrososphaerota archaeon]